MSSAAMDIELQKNKTDKELADIELDVSKNNFASEIKNISHKTLAIRPQTYKMPFSFRWRAKMSIFKEKIKTFFGF